jgi:hypothetical protein
MTCQCCLIARDFPGFRQFSISCPYCAARLITAIGQLLIADDRKRERRRAVLKDWLEHGHREDQIRDLYKRAWLLTPDIRSELENQNRTRRPSRGKK